MIIPSLAKEKYCTGCLSCIDACSHNAIDINYVNGLAYVSVNQNCVKCRQCERACPIVTPVRKNDVHDMVVYGGWSKDDDIRIKAASGGAFAALALSFFKKYEGAVVVGATLENNRVRHIAIERPDEIERLMNSKYIQSNTSGIYKCVKRLLLSGRYVLFSGTPCQIAGLYGFLGNKRDIDNLWTIELVCHGIPGYEALDLHLKYFRSPHIYSFRDKKEGQYWYASQRTTIDIDGAPVKISRAKDVFYRIFSSWLLDRRSCSNCKYSSIDRVADITLADFWGAPCDEKEFLKGVSLIIANNAHGNKLILNSNESLHYFESGLESAIKSNSNLYNGYKFIQYHPVVLFPNLFRKLSSEKLRLAILTNRMPWKLFWACYKIPTMWYAKLKKKNVLKKISNEKDRNNHNSEG